jgi:group I intron endonuclease
MEITMIATQEELKTLKNIIYLIKNNINNKIYIGQSTRTFLKRYGINWWNYPGINKHLRSAINKHGVENFRIEILERNINSVKRLNKLEREYIRFHKSDDRNFGYNKTNGGKNCKWSESRLEEHRQRNDLTTKRFIERAIEVHGNKYDYTEAVYINAHTKVRIKCLICDDVFTQNPCNHLFGKGCKKCANEKLGKNRRKFPEILEKVKSIHGERFDYSKIEYKNSKEPVQIICNMCNVGFYVPLSNFLVWNGCPKCESRTNGKKVAQIDIATGKIINIFSSAKKASETLGKSNRSNITKAAGGTRKTAYGFKWEHV